MIPDRMRVARIYDYRNIHIEDALVPELSAGDARAEPEDRVIHRFPIEPAAQRFGTVAEARDSVKTIVKLDD